MPGAKNGERPYLAVPEPGFLDPKIRVFRLFFIPLSLLFLSPITYTTLTFVFLFYFI